jgi:hypothetical protein
MIRAYSLKTVELVKFKQQSPDKSTVENSIK